MILALALTRYLSTLLCPCLRSRARRAAHHRNAQNPRRNGSQRLPAPFHQTAHTSVQLPHDN